MKNLLIICCIIFAISITSAEQYYTLKTIDTRTVQNIIHYLKPHNISDLNADTIQNIYYAPVKNECFAAIIKPKYATISSLLTKQQYKYNKSGFDGFTYDSISNQELKELYISILNKDTNKAFKIVSKIIYKSNKDNINIIWFGKDKYNRNTLYIYKLGFEHKGVVVFYPDNWDELIKSKSDLNLLMCKDPTRLGWTPFIDRFISVMQKYNQHIKITKLIEHNSEVYLLNFR